MMELNIRIGGEAGWGIATGAELLAHAFIQAGYHLFASKEYCSQIRGGHNYHTIRISSQPIKADVEKIDVLLALDQETLTKHVSLVSEKGIIFYDDKIKLEQKDSQFIPLNLIKIQEAVQAKNVHNSIFVGATLKALGLNFNLLEKAVDLVFENKADVKKSFLAAAKLSYDHISPIKKIELLPYSSPIDFIDGNEAITRGALKSGLSFHAQYPMTPVSGILHNLAKEAQNNSRLTVIQPEDEIAGINFALGASFAGARSMVATSGGGFALMTEALGLAGMAEIPLVLVEGQRPGPATGLPTKTEQGDLRFVLAGGIGEFPKVVIAPGSIEESYTETKRAFYLAEKYQLPVLILVDKYITESAKTLKLNEEEKKFIFDYEQRLNILTNVKATEKNPEGLYKRYAAGKLQRTLPGTKQGMFTCAGDEHDEVGEITEDPEIRIRMVQRRMQKLEQIQKELPAPVVYGPAKAKITVIGWGSNSGAIQEAIDRLNSEGMNINYLVVKYLCPFQTEEIKSLLNQGQKLVLIENNYSGQLAGLIQEKTGIEIKNKILRYDGRAFTINEIYQKLKLVKS